MKLLILLVWLQTCWAHSFLSCPLPYDNENPFRGGNIVAPCGGVVGPDGNAVPLIPVNARPVGTYKAGDRIKIGWPSLNHAGGYVRLALVPESMASTQQNFNNSLIKITCFGTQNITSNYPGVFGDCNHPCGARGPCDWQRNPIPLGSNDHIFSPLPLSATVAKDWNSYDTSISIPFNLADGYYVLQWMAVTGNSARVYYSCARLQITGGDSTLDCPQPDTTSWMNSALGACARAGGPPLTVLVDQSNKFGNFCFADPSQVRSGDSYQPGTVDDTLTILPPVNADCDPRAGCWSAKNQTACEQEFIASGFVEPKDPTLPFTTCASDVYATTRIISMSSTTTTTTSASQTPVSQTPICSIPTIITTTTVTTLYLQAPSDQSASSANLPTCTSTATNTVLIVVTSYGKPPTPSHQVTHQTTNPVTFQTTPAVSTTIEPTQEANSITTTQEVTPPSPPSDPNVTNPNYDPSDPCSSPLLSNTPCQGLSRCSGPYWATCSNGNWIVRACAPGTVCKMIGNSFICDYPAPGDCLAPAVKGAALVQ